MRPAVPQRLLRWAAILIVVFNYGRLIVSDAHHPEFQHFDEPNWIVVSVETWRHASAGQWDDPFWSETFDGWGAPSPQLGKLLIGAPTAWYLDHNPDLALNRFGSHRADAPAETAPAFQLYYPARLQAAICMLIIALLMIDLAATVLNGWAALAAAMLLIGDPYATGASFRAMTDACCLLGATLAFWGLFRRSTRAAVFWAGLGLGIAAATRFNGWLVAPVLALGFWLRNPGRPRHAVAATAAACGLALAACYATNPVLWRDPLAGWAAIARNIPGGGAPALLKPLQLLETIPGMFFESCVNGTISQSSLFTRAARLCCLVLGMAALARSEDSRRRSLAFLAAALWCLVVLSVPRPWNRYYLAGVPALCMIQGYGAWLACIMAGPPVRRILRRARRLEGAEARRREAVAASADGGAA